MPSCTAATVAGGSGRESGGDRCIDIARTDRSHPLGKAPPIATIESRHAGWRADAPQMDLRNGLNAAAQFGGEELRLLPGREVAAFVELVVVDQLRIRLLRPAPRRRIDLVGKGAHGDRDLDAPDVEEACPSRSARCPSRGAPRRPRCSSASRA